MLEDWFNTVRRWTDTSLLLKPSNTCRYDVFAHLPLQHFNNYYVYTILFKKI